MVYEAAVCQDHATEEVLQVALVVPPNQPDHIHDDGSAHTVIVVSIDGALPTGDGETILIAAESAPEVTFTGVIADEEHIFVDCQTHGMRCYFETTNGATAVCPLNGSDTLNAGTDRRSKKYEDGVAMFKTETGLDRCHADFDDESHRKSFHEVKV